MQKILTHPAQSFSLLLLSLLFCACVPGNQKTIASESLLAEAQVGITGQVTTGHGTPAAGAYIYAYRNQRSNLRGPADFESRVGKDGGYWLDVVEGNYYLVARMRLSGADAGPPKSGDSWALPEKNPVTVRPGAVKTVNFVLQGIAQPMLMRKGTLTSGDTGFTGLLLDAEARPLAGAFVIAYQDTDFQRMPEATSAAVGDDGRFHLYVERIGKWCLAARTLTRGQPVAGEPYGLLGKQEAGCRQAVPGEIIDVGTLQLKPYR